MWRASETKRLNIAVLIENNTSSDLVEEWYNEAMAEAAKMKKKFCLDKPETFAYYKWGKWDKLVEKYLSANFNL